MDIILSACEAMGIYSYKKMRQGVRSAMKYFVLTIFVCLLIQVTASRAGKMIWHEGTTSKYFDSAPASELLSAPEYKTYRKLIREMDCGPAALLLNKAFIRRYPQFIDAAAPRGLQFGRWYTFYVSEKFPDPDFCMASLGLKQHEMMLARDGTKIGKFFTGDMRKPPLLYWKDWRYRDTFVLGLIMRATQDHKPALLEIAKLAKRGDVFNNGPDFEFYLIKRACHLGASCAPFDGRLKKLEKMVRAEKIRFAAQTAKKKNIVLEMVYGKIRPELR